MSYIQTVIDFLNDYNVVIMPALFALVLLFGICNWCSNPYRKQNARLQLCTKRIISYPHKTALYANTLPEDYRRQWRAYLNSGAAKPSLVFEFVAKRQKTHLVWLFVITAVAAALYVVAFAFDTSNTGYLIFQVALWLAFGLTIVGNKAIKQHNEKKAKQTFAKLVAQLNRNLCCEQSSVVIEDTVKQLQKLNKQPANDQTVGKASQLLHNKGLSENRSVEQQRKLNTALNGLLQAYAKQAPKKI